MNQNKHDQSEVTPLIQEEIIKNNDLVSEEYVTIPESSESQELSFYDATKESARFGVPFAVSRLMGAIQNFGNGVVIVSMNIPDATAAGPIMFMVHQCVTGTAKGALSSINTIVSDLNGQKKHHLIGPALNQGLLMAVLIGTPTTILFFTSQRWLRALGIEYAIAVQAGSYLQGLSYGIIPTYCSIVDQNFLLSIKRPISPIVLNTLFVGASMLIGYPLAITTKDLAGLGYGVSAGALMTLIAGRYHLYSNKTEEILDYKKYNLLSKSFDSETFFKDLLWLGFPTSLQALSEWLPTMLITLVTARGKNAQQNLETEEPSMQTLVALNQILLGLGTAATVSVANALGSARRYREANNLDLANQWQKNARTIGYAELVVTTGVILPPALFCLIYPDPIVKLFSNSHQEARLAGHMLRFTGATLLIDGIRNTITGALLGRKEPADNFFTSLTNLLVTAVVATTLGYLTEKKIGPISFFLWRMIGISITSFLLLSHWDRRTKPSNKSIMGDKNTPTFWKKSSKHDGHAPVISSDTKVEEQTLNDDTQNGNFHV